MGAPNVAEDSFRQTAAADAAALPALLSKLDVASVQDDVLLCSRALHAAAAGGHTHVVTSLLHCGASPHGIASRQNKLATPVSLAAARGHTACVQLLLDAGANPNSNDARLVNAVIAAAIHGPGSSDSGA